MAYNHCPLGIGQAYTPRQWTIEDLTSKATAFENRYGNPCLVRYKLMSQLEASTHPCFVRYKLITRVETGMHTRLVKYKLIVQLEASMHARLVRYKIPVPTILCPNLAQVLFITMPHGRRRLSIRSAQVAERDKIILHNVIDAVSSPAFSVASGLFVPLRRGHSS